MTPDAINAAVSAEWPHARTSCIEVSDRHATAMLRPGDGALRPGGYVSGPTQFAAADAALWYLVFGAIDRIELLALTSELSIRFLRPAVGGELYATASLDGRSRRSVVGTVKVWTDDNIDAPCATAQGTYILPSPSAR
ncbi:MAG: PaaI family thioesterase [Pseudomonadota bacterium]